MPSSNHSHVQITQYTVSCIPEDSIDRPAFEIMVERRSRDRWAVTRNSRCLSRDGLWDYEPSPSSRDEDWLEGHRFTEIEALNLAAEWAPKTKVNGMTAAEAAAANGDVRDHAEVNSHPWEFQLLRPRDQPRTEPGC